MYVAILLLRYYQKDNKTRRHKILLLLLPKQFIVCTYAYSVFDGNFGGEGASVSLIYSTGNFNNVTFSNHRGPALRVSNSIYI